MLGIALLLLCVILIGTINAYFTDGETKTNTFTIGKVKIDLQEPNWTPPENITPNQEISKNPQIANTGKNEAFVYLEVHVPRQSIITAEQDGSRKVDSMFNSCKSLKELDLSNFDTSNVTTMSRMFYSCSNLSTLKVSKITWTINEENTNLDGMWNECNIQEPTHYL